MRILLTLFLAVLCQTAGANNFVLASDAFKQNEKIPVIYTCDGDNLSPELHWTGVPNGTQALVLIFESPDWPWGIVYKWIVYNLPGDLKSLPKGASEALPAGALTGNNYSDDKIYRGPCAPDSKLHHYVFTLYALDKPLDVDENAEPEDIVSALKGHILDKAELTGTYTH